MPVVEGPRYRDGCVHHVDEEARAVRSVGFDGLPRSGVPAAQVLADHFSSRDVLEFQSFCDEWSADFPDLDVGGLERCRREYPRVYLHSGRTFEYEWAVSDMVRLMLGTMPTRAGWVEVERPRAVWAHTENDDAWAERLVDEEETRRVVAQQAAAQRQREALEDRQHFERAYGYNGKSMHVTRELADDLRVFWPAEHPTIDHLPRMYYATAERVGKYWRAPLGRTFDLITHVELLPQAQLVQVETYAGQPVPISLDDLVAVPTFGFCFGMVYVVYQADDAGAAECLAIRGRYAHRRNMLENAEMFGRVGRVWQVTRNGFTGFVKETDVVRCKNVPDRVVRQLHAPGLGRRELTGRLR